jgi:general secretion pathway protein D
MKPKHLFAVSLAFFMFLVFVLEAKTHKGDKFLKEGQAAEVRGDWDKALDLYEKAVDTDPADIAYLVPMRKARFEAGQTHVKAGQKLRIDGKLEEAVQEFQRALIADPSSAIALQEIKRIRDMLQNPAKTGARADERGLSPAELSRRRSDDRVESMLGPPELRPMTAVIPVLKMNNQPPKVLFETVAKLAGVNVVFDSQYQAPARNFNVDLSNATADQAFDYLATLTHTFWKAITPNTIFVAEDNVTKRRDYEDDVVKVFYVTNATTVQEFQEIATAIRTVAEIRRVFTYNAQRAMIVRDTVDKVALAEKLVHDLDKPKSEVVVDVMVMQVNSERTRDLAATIASAGTAGLNVPIIFAPNGATLGTAAGTATGTNTGTTTGAVTAGTTGNTAITLAQLGHISSADFATTLPGGLLQAMLSDSRTKVLNQPQVRASDGQKVTLKIGSRIPYATGSFGSTLGGAGAGVSPLVSTQFNYADVGVSIDMTPQVHSTDEVTLHIEVTVSSVQQYINIGGISQPIIQQSANVADIRLREGEVNILGGLSQSQDTNLVNGIPGLVNIPVLGRTLFGSDHTDKVRAELMIALVPHIVRTPAYTAENLRGIYAGTDQVVKINYAPKEDEPFGSILQPAGLPTVAATPANAAPAIMPGSVKVSPPAGAPVPSRSTPMPVAPAATPASASATGAVAPGLAARVNFSPSTVQAADGATVRVNVQVENGAAMSSLAPLRIKYDPALLRLEDIAPGDIFSRGGGGSTSSKDIRNDDGEASITIERLPGAAAVNGPGTLAVLTFKAIGSGQAPVTIEEVALKDAQSHPVAASTATLGVQIQ